MTFQFKVIFSGCEGRKLSTFYYELNLYAYAFLLSTDSYPVHCWIFKYSIQSSYSLIVLWELKKSSHCTHSINNSTHHQVKLMQRFFDSFLACEQKKVHNCSLEFMQEKLWLNVLKRCNTLIFVWASSKITALIKPWVSKDSSHTWTQSVAKPFPFFRRALSTSFYTFS